jgi:hypothetical protein
MPFPHSDLQISELTINSGIKRHFCERYVDVLFVKQELCFSSYNGNLLGDDVLELVLLERVLHRGNEFIQKA